MNIIIAYITIVYNVLFIFLHDFENLSITALAGI